MRGRQSYADDGMEEGERGAHWKRSGEAATEAGTEVSEALTLSLASWGRPAEGEEDERMMVAEESGAHRG